MRILLDHNVPDPLRHWFPDQQVSTAYELGWARLTNGELLRSAEDAGFDVFVASDQSIRYQQNLAGRKLAFVVLSTNDWTHIRRCKSLVVNAIEQISKEAFVEIEIPLE